MGLMLGVWAHWKDRQDVIEYRKALDEVEAEDQVITTGRTIVTKSD